MKNEKEQKLSQNLDAKQVSINNQDVIDQKFFVEEEVKLADPQDEQEKILNDDRPQAQETKRLRMRSKYTMEQRVQNKQIVDQAILADTDVVKNEDKSANQGMFMGVILPCIQNIIGILLFLAQPAITGLLGIGFSFLVVFLSVLLTLCTTLSMAALVTNGKIKRGGTYYIISRSLGPAAGGSVGILFMLANAFGVGMYIIGAYQIFFNWQPQLTFPGYERIIGIVLLLCVYGLNIVGLKYVARTGTVFLVMLILAIFFMYLGFIFTPFRQDFQNQPENIGLNGNYGKNFVDNFGSPLYNQPGWFINYFSWAVGLYFPAVTDCMAGCNRSGDLKDPAGDLPRGTLFAQIFTSIVYLSWPVLYGLMGTREALVRGFYGPYSYMPGNVAALLSWPVPAFTNVAIMCASLGASLQSLSSAPRLFLAVSEDRIIPGLDYFGKNVRRPITAVAILSFAVVMIVNLNDINPYLTMFFLMCYGIINGSVLILTIQNAPNWRPRWRYYGKIQCIIGIALSLILMFIINWYQALIALGLVLALYIFIAYRVKKNYGDQISLFRYNIAIKSIISSSKFQYHVKTWKPHFLVLAPIVNNGEIQEKGCLNLLTHLERGDGLRIVGYVLPGKRERTSYDQLDVEEEKVQAYFEQQKIKKVLTKFVIADTIQNGYNSLMQLTGLGGIAPNTIILGFPLDWKQGTVMKDFIQTMDDASILQQNIVVLKPQQQFESNEEHQGYIDIWSFAYEKGLTEMFVYILQCSKFWKKCKVRMYVTSAIANNDDLMKQEILNFLKRYRILRGAEIQIINVQIQDIEQFLFGIKDKIQTDEQDLKKIKKQSQIKDEKHKLNQDLLQVDQEDLQDNLNVRLKIQRMENQLAAKMLDDRKQNMDQRKERQDSLLFRTNNEIVQSADKLNKIIKAFSGESDLIVTNLPDIVEGESLERYMEFCERFTKDLKRVMFVRNSGKEVITEFT